MILHEFYWYLAVLRSVPQKGSVCVKEQVCLPPLLLMSAITEAFVVKDHFLLLGHRLLIKLVERKAWAWKQGDLSNIIYNGIF